MLFLTSCVSPKPPEVHHANTKAVIDSIQTNLKKQRFKDLWHPLYYNGKRFYDTDEDVVTDIPSPAYLISPSSMKRVIYLDKQRKILIDQIELLEKMEKKQYNNALELRNKLKNEKKNRRIYQILTYGGIGLSVLLLGGIIYIGVDK